MPVVAGTRLGPYAVVELLGAGGMGAVYRARDPRLGRDVAIKVLPEDIASDPDRLRRFEQEARAVAALNHPNILSVYDVGTQPADEGAGVASAAVPYVVTELLEGENLREVLSRRSPTQRQVLGWGVQAAQGLSAAHRKGIVHRDLKPENLFLTTEGRIKVLDFGLAKVASTGVDSEEVTASSPTKPGVLMGTVAYMSPEQVQARPVDARSDLFSFGVVLYELLGRRHPFRRETVAATLTAILQEEPAPLGSLDPAIPRAVDGIVRRCLEKSREERFQGAHDLGLAIEAVLASPTGSAFLQEVEERSPYPGLASFTEKDAGVFFGRESEVTALWERIRERRLLAVIGPSGAGKTSFLRAGVIPARPEGWGAVLATPGAHPGLGLAHALTPELAGDAEAMRDLLSGVTELAQTGDMGRVVSVVKRWKARHAEALLVVDQFEELFTLNPPETRERFGALLARLASEAEVHVALSLRDDFLIRCCEQAPLAPVLTQLTALLPLGRDALRRALVEPARKLGYRFEDEALVEEMVESVEGARAALPLLAFAVARLWELRDRERKLLTREAHKAIGGVGGALAQHAEATLDRIGLERQGLVRELLRNLVTAQGTRAVIDREELLSAFPERAAAEEVLRPLVDARLLTTYEVEGKEGEPSRHRVEIVHESLLKAWPRLVRWQTQDEDGAQLRDQLKQAAHLWEDKGRTSDLLWTGTAYQEYELWRQRYPGGLTALEEDFARSMGEKARRKKRLVRLVATAAFLAITAVAVAIGVSRQQAVRAARRAEASKLVALGRNELDRYPTAALAYARKSLETADTGEARRLAVEALWRAPAMRLLPVENGGTWSIAFSPDGTKLAAYTFSDKIVLYPQDGSAPRAIGGFATAAGPTSVTFTPEGDAVLGWWPGTPVRMASVADGRELRTFGPRLPRGGPGRLGGFSTAPHGLLVGTLDGDGPDALLHLRLEPYDGGDAQWVGAIRQGRAITDDAGTRWAIVRGGRVYLRPVAGDERTPETEITGLGTGGQVNLAFDPTGERLAVADTKAGLVTLWPTRSVSPGPLRTLRLANPDPQSSPAFDGAGAHVAWGSTAERAVAVWSLDDPPDAAARVLRRPDAQVNISAAFQPRGQWVAVPQGEAVAFWSVRQPWPRALGGHRDALQRLRFTSDSGRLVSCARDGLAVWPLRPGGAAGRRAFFEDRICYGLALTPDDRRALWGGIEVHLASTEDGNGTYLSPPGPVRDVTNAAAIDPSGRWGATTSSYTRGGARKAIRMWDLASGKSVREWPQAPSGKPDEGYEWVAFDVAFQRDGRLIVGQAGGVRLIDVETGVSQWLWALPPQDGAFVSVSSDGRRAVAVRLPGATDGKFDGRGDIVLFDLERGSRQTIASHGDRFASLALDADGSVLVTGDPDGAVRVGPSDGRAPHLLCCHAGRVDALAVSPDGRWVASGAGSEIRLWPMPDVTKPPLHTLPYQELMAKLRAMTNLVVVADEASSTGYKLDIGPFPGWKDVPTW